MEIKIFIAIALCLFLLGCATPPWTKEQIQRFENQKVENIPVITINF